MAVLFRLNSAKKWRWALEQKLLPEAVRRWLGIGELAELIEKATVDWIPPQVFCERTGRTDLSPADQEVLMQAFEQLDWRGLGSLGRNRHLLLGAIRDTLGGQLVTPLSSRVGLDSSPRDGPLPADIVALAKGLAAEFLERMKVFGEKFNSSTFYEQGNLH